MDDAPEPKNKARKEEADKGARCGNGCEREAGKEAGIKATTLIV